MSDTSAIFAVFILIVGSIILKKIFRKRLRSFEVVYSLPIDGDTLFIEHGRPRIRLFGIDAPELGQDHGMRSKAALRKLIQGENLIIKPVNIDKYNRIVATVLRARDGLDINGAMVSHGFALADTAFTSKYKSHERKAKRARSGLWDEGGISSPKHYRRQQKSAARSTMRRA